MTKTSLPGINYSMDLPMSNGKRPNIDEDTGIRYGVISVHAITQAWGDSSEPEYICGDCESWDAENEECLEDFCDCEAAYFLLDDGEYYATQSADDTDIFVIKSPFYTYAQFCSPCAPGACHLNNPLEDPVTIDHKNRTATINYPNNKCYCFGKDWFDDEFEPCPYPIWRVDTGERVYEPKATGEVHSGRKGSEL